MPTAKAVREDLFTEEKKKPLPELDDVQIRDEDKAKLINIVKRRRAISDQIKTLAAQEDEFNERVIRIFKRNKIERVRVEGHPAYIVKSGHTTIDENKLIEKGVSPKLIARCKVYVPHKEFIRIDAAKEE